MDDNLLTIIPPPGDGLKTCNGTRFVLSDGTELRGVERCAVTFARDCILRATVELAIDPKTPIEAQPLLGLATVRAAAEHYGYLLVADPGAAR